MRSAGRNKIAVQIRTGEQYCLDARTGSHPENIAASTRTTSRARAPIPLRLTSAASSQCTRPSDHLCRRF